jgi:hypothetical protein
VLLERVLDVSDEVLQVGAVDGRVPVALGCTEAVREVAAAAYVHQRARLALVGEGGFAVLAVQELGVVDG